MEAAPSASSPGLHPSYPQHPQVPAPLSAWALGLPPLSRFLSTGFLRGSFVGVSAPLYLESFVSLPFIPLTEFLDYIYLYLFFSKSKIVREPQSSTQHLYPGPTLHVTGLRDRCGTASLLPRTGLLEGPEDTQLLPVS